MYYPKVSHVGLLIVYLFYLTIYNRLKQLLISISRYLYDRTGDEKQSILFLFSISLYLRVSAQVKCVEGALVISELISTLRVR